MALSSYFCLPLSYLDALFGGVTGTIRFLIYLFPFTNFIIVGFPAGNLFIRLGYGRIPGYLFQKLICFSAIRGTVNLIAVHFAVPLP